MLPVLSVLLLVSLTSAECIRNPTRRSLFARFRGGGGDNRSTQLATENLAARLAESALKFTAETIADGSLQQGDSSQPNQLPLAFLLDSLQRRKNVDSIILTAQAAGASGRVWTLGSTPSPSELHCMDCEQHSENSENAIKALQSAGVVVWALSMGDDAVTLDAALDEHFAHGRFAAIALVVGNEISGVRCSRLCDKQVYIPTFQNRELNAAFAACQAAFVIADRFGLARNSPALIARFAELSGLP